MVTTIFTLVRRLWTPPAPADSVNRRSLLGFEPLDDRTTPAAFVWKATISESWSDILNWQQDGGPALRIPGDLAVGKADTVTIDDTAQRNCVLDRVDSGVRINALTMTASANRVLTVPANVYLFVQGGDPGGALPRGQVLLASGGALEIKGSVRLMKTDMTWKSGAINTFGNPGTLYVINGSNLNIVDAGVQGQPSQHHLGAHLQVSTPGQVDTGFVHLATTGQNAQQMKDNLTLFHNIGITINAGGALFLNQSTKSDTQGGIVKDVNSPDSVITNRGLIDRRVKDDQDTVGNIVHLKIEPLVKTWGRVQMADLSSLEFTNGIQIRDGTFDQIRGRVKTPPTKKVSMTGGEMWLRGVGASSKCLFTGDVEILGGSVYVGENRTADAAADKFVEMRVTGDLDIGSASVYLSIDVGVSERGDVIRVDGHMSVDPIYVELTLVNNSQALWADIASRSWTFLSATTADGYPGPGGIQAAVNGTEYFDYPDPDVERYTYNGPPDDGVPYYLFRYRPVT
jgi:hypothetical protein